MFFDKIIINEDLEISPQIINSKNDDKNNLDDTLSASEVYVSKSKLKKETEQIPNNDIKKDFIDVLKIVKELIKQNSVLKEKINDLNKKVNSLEEHNKEKNEKNKHSNNENLNEINIKKCLEEYNNELKKNITEILKNNMIEIMKKSEKYDEDRIANLFNINFTKIYELLDKKNQQQNEEKNIRIMNDRQQFKKMIVTRRR